jgi:hypothetical protein
MLPKGEAIHLLDPVSFNLDEPNVLVLDQAEYSLDGGNYEGPEEILRLDTKLRELLGWPGRYSRMAQPWVMEQEDGRAGHRLSLRFRVHSQIDIPESSLAAEQGESLSLTVNGEDVSVKINGWFTDRSISTVGLPVIPRGESILEISFPYGPLTNPEWCYLLGDFGVTIHGSRATVVSKPETVYPGDLTRMGFPFYGANFTYRYIINESPGLYRLEIPKFRNPVVSIELDGKPSGKIALAPYTVDLDLQRRGEHRLDITVFGNRYNSFGQLHNSDETLKWAGPNAWRTQGNCWSYEYRLRPNGLLSAPKLSRLERAVESIQPDVLQ